MREFLKYIPFKDIKTKDSSAGVLMGQDEHIPVISLMGVVQGEILECLEVRGRLALKQILESLHRPTHIVAMSLGALVYSGLVKAEQGKKIISVWIEPKK
jgi:predicted transcriptional regulator